MKKLYVVQWTQPKEPKIVKEEVRIYGKGFAYHTLEEAVDAVVRLLEMEVVKYNGLIKRFRALKKEDL